MSSVIYQGIEIKPSQNSFSGLWGASYSLPGEDESHTGYFGVDEKAAILGAKINIQRAVNTHSNICLCCGQQIEMGEFCSIDCREKWANDDEFLAI